MIFWIPATLIFLASIAYIIAATDDDTFGSGAIFAMMRMLIAAVLYLAFWIVYLLVK